MDLINRRRTADDAVIAVGGVRLDLLIEAGRHRERDRALRLQAAAESADRMEQVFPAMDTVTVDGADVGVLEHYDGGDELIAFVLAGHLTTPTALSAVRAWIDGPMTALCGASPYGNGLGSEDRVWSHAADRLSHTRIRVVAWEGEEAWMWADTPTGTGIPVTVYDLLA
ncbi:hypothetical protein Ga0074812_1576 [Parafrankia irregularis]|uniref:Uncharacterized protein n=1 Tax=Parafrankia irregularis TaxID=795642 RepID=A0A0S4R1M9_9ACTN|nr:MULTISPECIES: hypothetical protein [Parafrankia]MBE3206803.1 hypothetical protein [Parafrankia sp. CH37]MBE3206828.1 hypothetical protein [Parafrankia sp. CH37]CUU61116.1 hypothetical protein Ga0074812_1576 [Parafrankia irregularis]